MKIVLAIPTYLPGSVGGTEIYTQGLAQRLIARGHDCIVATPGDTPRMSFDTYNGVPVARYPRMADAPSRHAFVDTGSASPVFVEWLSQYRPDAYHQNDWAHDCTLSHLRAASDLGIRTYFTVHFAYLICRMSTMLRNGLTQCSGRIEARQCSSCRLRCKGVPSPIAEVLGAVPDAIGARLGRIPVVGDLLDGPGVASRMRHGLHQVAGAARRIVVPAEWVRQALIHNEVSPDRIALVRNGVDDDVARAPYQRRSASNVLRIGFLGRLVPAKGLHIVIEAMKRLPPGVRVELHALASRPEVRTASRYEQSIIALSRGDDRINLGIGRPRSEVAQMLSKIDALAIPSQCIETGPLTVYEAFAAGVPVIGSDFGGIRELVSHEKNGLLVRHADVAGWTSALVRLAGDLALRQRLSSGIAAARSMEDNAIEMEAVYQL